MLSQLTTDEQALRLFFTDDIYLVTEPEVQQNREVQEETMGEVPKEVKTAAPAFKFLGNNKRNILILVNDQENDVSDEKGRELLRKIVKSVNLTANDFALMNYAHYTDASFAQLQDHFSSVIVFAFGVSPRHLSLSDHPENTVVTEGEVKLIFSAELRKLEEDQNGKKVLWGSLKQLGI
ncbi:MAG TPA: hypothetical protein VK541_13730 [Pedobacter sp.]|uniref:hypothetical protein n=1 Tax=Pedobacter sp. TaxID=1411316 RepID=UPI002BF77FEE|nr:hypothetical protein [Pedobacter sp.]HMI03545.1 hypothetical protein [Pedobacter sp.]